MPIPVIVTIQDGLVIDVLICENYANAWNGMKKVDAPGCSVQIAWAEKAECEHPRWHIEMAWGEHVNICDVCGHNMDI